MKLLLALLSIAAFTTQAASPPNIVFILADDLGWTDLACQGSQYYETPNIDRLAAQGVRLTSYHHCQNCAPTRAALMSGQYAPRTGTYTVGGINRFDWSKRPLRPVDNVTELPLEKITIAQALKNNGYRTGMFGKWHLGNGGDYHPSKRGFEEAIVTAGRHFKFVTDPSHDIPDDLYLADYLTDKAEGFIRRHKDKPFFLYLPHFGVHSPYQAKAEWIAHFKDKPGVGGHKDPVYAAMIASVDESVGRIMALLDELKLADNTVLIFSSDNGGVGGYAREGIAKDESGGVTDNAPLRSGKGSLYEGGTRVPFIARWPGTIPPGTTCNAPGIHVDLYPTLLEIAGATSPQDYTLDGSSLVPVFRSPAEPPARGPIFQHFPGYLGIGKDHWRTTPVSLVQEGDWKLMEFFEDGRLELYRLDEDLGEQHDLATSNPEKAAELHAQLKAWRAAIQAPMPAKNDGSQKAKGKGGNKGKAKARPAKS